MAWNTLGSSNAMAVPIWMAEAPASRNSTASCHVVMPPQPMIGAFSWASKMS